MASTPDEQGNLVPAHIVAKTQPAPDGKTVPLATETDTAAEIERYTKMLGELRPSIAATDGQMTTMPFSRFSTVALGLALVGFWVTRASVERVAASDVRSAHFIWYYTFLLLGGAAFAKEILLDGGAGPPSLVTL